MNFRLGYDILQLLKDEEKAVDFISQLGATVDENTLRNAFEFSRAGMSMKDAVAKAANYDYNKVALIKAHRGITGLGLKESKEWIEATFEDEMEAPRG